MMPTNVILNLFILYALQWVSHRNHRGNICGVDFIWLCNPNKSRKPLKTSWGEAVFGILKVSNLFVLFCIISIKLSFYPLILGVAKVDYFCAL